MPMQPSMLLIMQSNGYCDQQTRVGAMQSRLDYTQSNITTQHENVSAAMETLIGADLAKAITEYTANNIQMQAAQAMLAQVQQ